MYGWICILNNGTYKILKFNKLVFISIELEAVSLALFGEQTIELSKCYALPDSLHHSMTIAERYFLIICEIET